LEIGRPSIDRPRSAQRLPHTKYLIAFRVFCPLSVCFVEPRATSHEPPFRSFAKRLLVRNFESVHLLSFRYVRSECRNYREDGASAGLATERPSFSLFPQHLSTYNWREEIREKKRERLYPLSSSSLLEHSHALVSW
jgi:hypothetical protein